MHPTFVRKVILPLLMRGTWPRVVRLRRDLEASQWWPRERVLEEQWRKVQGLLRRAEEQSPFFGERLAAAGLSAAGIQSPENLEGIPPLEKAELQEARERILCRDADRARLTMSATGGTTGEPTRYYWDDDYWCASSAVTLRAYGMAGFEMGDRHCMVWGTAFHSSRRAAWMETLQQRLKNVLVVPGFELSRDTLAFWTDRVRRQRPVLVEGYTSLLVLFATWLLEEGIEDIRPRAVISSAEKLHDFQRELIGEALGAPVFDRYGSREVGCIAHECREGRGLHVNSEHVYVEIVRGNEKVPPGESGEILVTCLSNQVFPFIRYRIGDMGTLVEEPCPCGRGLPLLKLTEGRTHDLLTTSRGTWLPGEFFPHLMKEFPGVAAFQVHQAADLSVTVRLVTTAAFSPEQEAAMRREVEKALGPGIPVTYERVSEIPRTASGKLRFTVSEVPVDLARGSAARAASESEEEPGEGGKGP